MRYLIHRFLTRLIVCVLFVAFGQQVYAQCSITATPTPVTCFNTTTGSISVTATGGVAPYSYQLGSATPQAGSTFTGLAAGSYTITVRDAAATPCVQTTTVVVSGPTAVLAGTFTSTPDLLCSGLPLGVGSATVNASGGTPPYQYSFEGGAFLPSNVYPLLGAGNYTVTIRDANACTANVSVTVNSAVSTLNADIQNQQDAPCGGKGSVTLVGRGGTAPYRFRLGSGEPQANGNFSNLDVGEHIITVLDNAGCARDITVTIKQAASNVSGTVGPITNASCSGAAIGSFTVTGTGGDGNYQYRLGGGAFQLSGTFSNLADGNYVVTVQDGLGCIGTVPVTVGRDASPVTAGTTGQVDVPCSGGDVGQITLVPGGGQAPYEFRRGNGAYVNTATFTGLAVGEHTFTVRDNLGCTKDVTITIAQLPSPVKVQITDQTKVSCNGSVLGTVIVSGTGGNGSYTYKLGNGAYQSGNTFNNLAVGDHVITAKDADGCTGEITVKIERELGTVTAVVQSLNDVPCMGGKGSVTISAGGGTPTYLYRLNNGANQTSPTFNNLDVGQYTVTVEDALGCTKDVTFTISRPTNTIIASTTNQVNALCVGGKGSITAVGSGGFGNLQYSLDGGLYQTTANFTAIDPGLHTITVRDEKGCTQNATFTILEPTAVTATPAKVDIPCPGTTGSVTVTGGGGTPPYQYQITGRALQTTATFTGLAQGSYTATVQDANGCIGTANFTIVENPNTVTAEIESKTPVGCVGGNTGSVTIKGGGGTAPLQYKLGGSAFQLSPTFNNVGTGTYVATVRDANGCSRDVSVTIDQLQSTVRASIVSQTTAPCSGAGATAVISATGGNGTYTYKLGTRPFQTSGTFTGIPAGTYVVIAQDGLGCTDDTTLVITDMVNTVGATITKTNITCTVLTGTATVTGTGGTAPFTYRIDGGAFVSTNTFSNLPQGTHTLTVRDVNGCTKDTSVIIDVVPNTIVASLDTKTDVPCGATNVGALTIKASGGVGTLQYRLGAGAYQNSPTFTGLAVADYVVTVRDANGCTREVPVSITQLANTIVASVASKTDVPCAGGTGSVTISASGGVGTLRYKRGTGALQPSPTFSGLPQGDYIITVQDVNGCTKDVPVTIGQVPNTISATIGTKTDVTCAGSGSVTINASGGAGALQYKLGVNAYQTSPTFTNLPVGDYVVTVRDTSNCTRDVPVAIALVPNTLGVTATPVNVPCAGTTGSVTINVTGGVAPFEYKLNTTTVYQNSANFSALAPGNYTATVRDKNLCTKDVSFTIGNAPNTVTLTLSGQSDIPCGGGFGRVTVSGGGGSAPYQYRLDGNAFQNSGTYTSLLAGDHTITVRDAAGCTKDTTITVKQIQNTISATVGSKTDAACGGNNGSVTINASGGTAPLSFQLGAGAPQASPTFANLAAGNYTVTVRDANNCSRDVSVVISPLPNTVDASVSNKTDITCATTSGSATIAASGGTAPYTYSLDGGAFVNTSTFTGLTAVTHTVTVRDSRGCTDDVSFQIGITPNNVTALVSNKVDIPCNGGTGSVTITPGGGKSPYQFSLNGAAYQNSATFTGLTARNYTVTVRDDNGCTKDVSFVIDQIQNTVTASISAKTDVTCAGPNSGAVTVAGGGGTAPYNYRIGNAAFQTTPTFSGLATGSYTFTVRDANGCTQTVSETIDVVPNTVSASIAAKSDIPCVGGAGSITLSGGGGAAPYQYRNGNGAYQNSPTFNNLALGNYTFTVRDANGCTKEVSSSIGNAPNTVDIAVVSKTDIPCSGGNVGAVTVAGSGGTGPYQYRDGTNAYQSAATFTGLAAGDHVITVRDSFGCTDQVTVTIGQQLNTVVANLVSKTDISCVGGNTGAINVSASGGTAPYEFRLGTGAFQSSGTFSNLGTGTYVVTVRDVNGCTNNVSVILNPTPNTVSANISSKTDITCSGGNTGSVTISGGGGTAPYTYKLGTLAYQQSPTFNNLAAGDYIATVRDANGCTKDVTVKIEQTQNTVSVSIAAQSNIPCAGGFGSVTLNGGGGTAPYQYKWGSTAYQNSGSFTNIPAGDHVFTVRDAGGCTKDIVVSISQTPNNVVATLLVKTDVPCSGNIGSFTVAGSGGTAPYQYRLGTGPYQLTGAFVVLGTGVYTVTVRDANGCTKDINVPINQIPSTVNGTVTAKTDVPCSGGNSGSLTISGSGGVAPYSYKLGTGSLQSSGTFNNLAAGDYNVTVQDALGCFKEFVATVGQINNTINASALTKTDITCFGANNGAVSVTASGGTTPYTFRLDNGVFQGNSSFTNLTPGDHTVTVRDAIGCTRDVDIVISQPAAALVPSIGSKADIPCTGGKGSATITATGGRTPYQFKVGTGAYQSSGSFNNLDAGTYTATVRDAGGCARDITFIINQTPNNVTATVSNKTDIPCSGGKGAVTVAGGGGTAPYQYKLGNGAFQDSGAFTDLDGGNYIVTVRDASGCTRDLAVIINQAPNNVNGTITSKTDASCSGGNTGSVTIAGSGGTGGYTYSLNAGPFQSANTFNNLAAGDYTITVKDGGGCTKDVAVNIAQASNTVTGTVTSKTDVPCSGGNVGAVTVAGSGGSAPYQYKLGNRPYQNNGTFTNLAAGSYVVTIRDASGCTNDLAVVIGQTQNTILGTVASQTDVPCAGGNVGSVTMTATGGTAPYTFRIGQAAYQSSATFNNLAAGDYIVTIRDATGCTKEVNVTIAQKDNTVTAAVASKTDIPCSGGNIGSFTIAAAGGTSPYTYKLGNGAYQNSATFNNLAQGSYTVTVKDASGCTKEITVVIDQLNNTVTAAVGSKIDVPCAGGNVGYVTILAGGGTAPYTYKLGTGPYQTSATFTDLAAGNYTATVKDASGCLKDVSFRIDQLNNTVTGTISSKTDIPCSGGNVGSVTVTGGGGTAPYEFKIGAGAYQSSGTFGNLAAGDYTVTVKDARGCTKEVAVTIAPAGGAAPGSISPNNSDPLCEGDSKVLTASSGVTYQWYRNDTLITGATSRDYTATVSGRYSVEISNGTCAVKAANTVQLTFRPCVSAEIFVPTAFTPNSNNKNDKLLPRFNAVRELKSFKIYNRWGQLMYTTSVVGEGWDGTFKGVRQPMETYSWVLECVDNNGNSVKRSGKTILIR